MAQAREAAMLLAAAQGHIADEEDEDALVAAQDALTFFRGKGDAASLCDALCIVVQCYIAQNRIGEATSLAQEEMANFRKAGKKQATEEAKMLLALSEAVASNPKQADEALSYSKQALDLFRSAKNEDMEAKVWLHTAKVLIAKMGAKKDEDALNEAEQAAGDALAISQRTGDQKCEAAALHASASVKAAQGDLGEAVELAEQAVDLYQELGLKKLEAFELHAIAKWCVAKKPFKALNYAEDALMIARSANVSKKKEAEVLATVADALIAKDDTDRAVRISSHGLKRAQDAGDARAEAAIQRVLFRAYTANGDIQKATLTLDKALEACQDAGDRDAEGQLLCVAASMNLKAEQHDQAAQMASRALETARASQDWTATSEALKIFVTALLAKGDAKLAADAAREVRDAVSAASEGGQSQVETVALVSSSLLLSQALNVAGDYNEAVAATKMAVECAYQGDDEIQEARCLDQLGAIYMDARKFEKAARTAERARSMWQSLEDIEQESGALYQSAQAYISQAYKKLSEGKSSAATSLIEKCDKAMNDFFTGGLREKLPSPQQEVLAANFMCVATQKHLACDGETVGAYNAAKAAVDLFTGLGDVKGIANAQFFMAQAQVSMTKWEGALKNANAAMKVYKKFNNEEGTELAQILIDKIQKSMPKPEPVYAPQQMQSWGPMPQGGAKGKGKGKPQMMDFGPDPMAGMQVERAARTGSALDMSSVTEEIVANKVKEVAMSIIGDGENIEVDTPLMEAGLTSSTAVILKDEVSEEIPGVRLPPTLIFDYPSISAISEFIMEKVGK